MINYDGRRFQPTGHGPDAPITTYRQDGDLLWADLFGGKVRRGALCGRCDGEGVLDFTYSMVLKDGRVIAGHCRSTPEVLADGRIRLHEAWERYGPYAEAGVGELGEVQ